MRKAGTRRQWKVVSSSTKVRNRPHRPGRGARSGLAAICLALLPLSAFSEARVDVSVADQGIEVRATAASRREILHALAAEGLLDVAAAQSLDQRIDFDIVSPSLGDLLQRLLRQHSYVYIQQPGIDRLLILAKGHEQSAARWRATAREAPTVVHLELTDPDPEVRLEAVLATADLATSTAVQLLVPSIHDPAPAVRDAAEAVLEDLGATDYLGADRLSE